jgi:hypothetical protein
MGDAKSQKDLWDRISSLATILIPAAIALAGHFIAQGLKQAELSSEERRAEQTRILAEANTRVAQATLINTLMKSLTSANPQERKLAIEAVLIALPEQGSLLVRVIAQNDDNKAVQVAAKSSLEQHLAALVRDLFSENAGTRITSAQELIQGWRNQSSAVSALIDYALENKGNSNGVYNSVVVLSEFTPMALEPNRAKLLQLIEVAKTIGTKTAEKAAVLQKRLGG